jgi:hypothetical protein
LSVCAKRDTLLCLSGTNQFDEPRFRYRCSLSPVVGCILKNPVVTRAAKI